MNEEVVEDIFSGLKIGDEVKYDERTVYKSGMVVDWEIISRTVVVYDFVSESLVRRPVSDFTRIGRVVS